MQRFVRGITILLALTAPASGFAQQATDLVEQTRAARPAATRDKDEGLDQSLAGLAPENCFTSGSGKAFLKICITVNGNISWLESPAGAVHIKTREGYAVCNYDGAFTVYGFDANIASDGWGPAIVSDNKRVITRTSLDGAVQLKQTFTIVPAARGVDVKMEVKNLTPLTLNEVLVSRYFDGDIDGQQSNKYFHTGESVWATEGRGVMLTARPSTSLHFYPQVNPFFQWNPIGGGGQLARECSGSVYSSGVEGDYVGGLITTLYAIKPGQTKSVTLYYRRF